MSDFHTTVLSRIAKKKKKSCILQSLTNDSHAYTNTQVRRENRERDPHGPDFGTMLRAVDTRMRHLTGLSAVNPASEHYRAYAR